MHGFSLFTVGIVVFAAFAVINALSRLGARRRRHDQPGQWTFDPATGKWVPAPGFQHHHGGGFGDGPHGHHGGIGGGFDGGGGHHGGGFSGGGDFGGGGGGHHG